MTGFSPLFDIALLRASEWHRTQTRKATGVPYICHPLIVAGYVIEDGGSEEEAIAALFHDAAEDAGGEEILDYIGKAFGPTIAFLVRECSDSLLPKGVEKKEWRERKEEHLREILNSASLSAVKILAADTLSNVRSLLSQLDKKGLDAFTPFKGGVEGTLWYLSQKSEVISYVFYKHGVESINERQLEKEVKLLRRKAQVFMLADTGC